MSYTYTYSKLHVSRACFEEIYTKLEAAGYATQFSYDSDGQILIDMHGLALVEPAASVEPEPRPALTVDATGRVVAAS